ncbi:uncharacterized protein Dsimw501_GD27566, isoform A [Drosophila simulans]|nr:uncharacterized protein Dsimw501_GD27566, isoform A [Drosophila simulans]
MKWNAEGAREIQIHSGSECGRDRATTPVPVVNGAPAGRKQKQKLKQQRKKKKQHSTGTARSTQHSTSTEAKRSKAKQRQHRKTAKHWSSCLDVDGKEDWRRLTKSTLTGAARNGQEKQEIKHQPGTCGSANVLGPKTIDTTIRRYSDTTNH